ncbi:MAG: response regulator [Gemmatimonadetes bacterium]|nr:response regulator [Gemmatimonadota bacterium]
MGHARQSDPPVLILDDEENVRVALRLYLERHRYTAVEADTVDSAVERMRETKFEAVIFDLRLPGAKSGIDALNTLRRIPEFANVPVLIVTGSILSEDEERQVTRQRAHVVYKPEGFSTVVNFLDQLTGRDFSH